MGRTLIYKFLFLAIITNTFFAENICANSADMNKPTVTLNEIGWRPQVKEKLIKLIEAGKYKNLPVIFDFDNTLVCRDIGEATFALMVRDGVLRSENIPKTITPNIFAGYNLITTYEKYAKSGSHHVKDLAPYLNAYGWLVEIMADLTPLQITQSTKHAYSDGVAESDLNLPAGLTSIYVSEADKTYLVPYFYPEMVELVGELLRFGYDVWVISASNVWSIRWMVTHVLNKKLKQKGIDKSVKPEQVIGISTLLSGPDERLYKDNFLSRENHEYAHMYTEILNQFTLTSHIVPPMSSYYGKAANVMQWIKTKPYLVAGDSSNDHAMLAMAENKLWITRVERPSYQAQIIKLVRRNSNSWMLQPVLTDASSGFVSSLVDLETRTNVNYKAIEQSLSILNKAKLLVNF